MTNELFYLILVGMLVMLFLAIAVIFFIIFYQKRIASINEEKARELTQAAFRGEEDERNRIAAELHDDVGATLTSVKLYLPTAARHGDGSDAYKQSTALLNESIKKVRDLSHRLQPTTLEQFGLSKALPAYFNILNASEGIKATYIESELPALDNTTGLMIYRIIQEITNNILKHAGAHAIELAGAKTMGKLIFSLTHDGQGLTQKAFKEYIYKENTTGLKNIVNRVKTISGDIQFSLMPDGRYKVELLVPVKA